VESPSTHRPCSRVLSPQLPVRKFIKILGAFSFKILGALPLTEHLIDFTWRQIIYPLIPAGMTSFTDYFKWTWIGTSAQSPLCPQSKWNHHEDTQLMLPRSPV
jgi:hypothetical protein